MAEQTYLIDPRTRLGTVGYTTADLDGQLDFYTSQLGLQLHWKDGNRAGLGTGGEDLLQFTRVPGARRYPGTTGMYHFALLLPDRKELARVIARLYQRGIPNFPTDHVFTKTTYLDDPEGNTIEIYTYSLEDGEFSYQDGGFSVKWADGRPSNGREALDLGKLFEELSPEDDLNAPLPENTSLGHVHLYGNSLTKQMAFYRDVLGFREGGMGERIGMAEVALDRPHVIAFNVWQGVGAPPPPENAIGIRFFSILLPDAPAYQRVMDRVVKNTLPFSETPAGSILEDPSGIRIQLSVEDRKQ